MSNQVKHQEVLEELYAEYIAELKDDEIEFIWDGPAHWDKFEEKENIRIIFLGKESHSSYHPSTPSLVNDKFSRNIARWTNIIISNLHIKEKIVDPYSDDLQAAFDRIAIVEVKKINEDKTRSIFKDIEKFAWIGRAFLKEQLAILKPQIIVCCGTLVFYDIINNYSEEDKNEMEKLIYNNNGVMAWNTNDVIVLSFCHPSSTHMTEKEMCDSMQNFISDPAVQSEYLKIKKNGI